MDILCFSLKAFLLNIILKNTMSVVSWLWSKTHWTLVKWKQINGPPTVWTLRSQYIWVMNVFLKYDFYPCHLKRISWYVQYCKCTEMCVCLSSLQTSVRCFVCLRVTVLECWPVPFSWQSKSSQDLLEWFVFPQRFGFPCPAYIVFFWKHFSALV